VKVGSGRHPLPESERPGSRGSRGLELWLFATFLVLQLVPLWAFADVPTQDGPARQALPPSSAFAPGRPGP
jgi:hypothetical protein